MPLFRLSDLSLSYGPQVLLDKVDLTIHAGERIGLLGRNGAGKSTFLKLLAGRVRQDGGELWRRPGTRVASLEQELPERGEESVYDFVAGGLAEVGDLLKRYHRLAARAGESGVLEQLDRVQKEIEQREGWLMQQKVDSVVSTLGLPADDRLSELSGGWLRRAALGRALVQEPEVLLLDEPTNHLDIPAIEWLERQLQDFRGAVVLITHDRSFLQKVANRIMELDRGHLHSWKYDYQGFLQFREQQLAAEEKANQEFDKKLAQEETWIRQGIKARRTRNEGRVRALEKMREEFRARRQLQGKARMQLNAAQSSGKIVVEAENISHAFAGKPILRDFSTTLLRGDKVGFIGPNGAGKTTLLKILLGELKPDAGTVKIGSRLEVAWFDQLRAGLDPNKSVRDNLSEGRDYVEVGGKPRHVMSYLQDFLFTPDRVRQPAGSLSGGEQNRLILARLFSTPANLLVMDEPTNDLDLETLELLEELLLEFQGTLLLVSHDRVFLDNVVTSSIVFEGRGRVAQYVGGYQDWLDHGGHFDFAEPGAVQEAPEKSAAPPPGRLEKKTKLSYKLQRELEQLPARIEDAEGRIAALERRISDPAFYEGDRAEIDGVLKELACAQEELEGLYSRWENLEQQQQQQ